MKMLIHSLYFIFLFVTLAYPQTSEKEDSLILDFIYQIQNSLNENHPEFLDNHINLTLMADRIFIDLTVNDEFKKGFLSGIGNSLKLGQQITTALGEEGHYTALSYSVNGDTLTAFYRLVGVNGLNYHEYLILRTGKFEIVDMYTFINGQYISEALRQMVEPLILQDDTLLGQLGDLSSRLFGDKRKYLQDIKRIEQIKNQQASGHYDKANQIYESLSENIKHQKVIQLLNIASVYHLDPELLYKYIDIYRNDFPDDVSVDLLMIDYFILQKDYENAIQSIRNFEMISDTDGYLQYLKSNIYYEMGNEALFIKFAEKCIETEPWLTEPYYSLMDYYLPRKEFGKVIQLMEGIKENAGIIFEEQTIKEIDIFKGLLNSPEYKKWKSEN